MKLPLLAILLIFCFSCKEKNKTINKKILNPINNKILKPEFQTIIDSSNVKGSILIYDLEKDTYYSNDFKQSNIGHLPASTFKITNSIIGLETGVIENDSTIFKWDGKKKWLKNWEQDLVLKKAFQFSCVPCYQGVARKIGVKKMNDYIQKFEYGNLKIDSTNIDKFWLEGASRISQMQQIDFLKRFYNRKLPIAERTVKIVRNIMQIEQTEHYKLSGKTGLSITNEKYNGWFVGYVEINKNTYFFATNLDPKKDFDLDSFVKKRQNLTLAAFKVMNILN